MFVKGDTIGNILAALVLALTILVCSVAFVTVLDQVTKTEVETYSVGCEVSQMAYAEETTGRASSRPAYKMGVRCDDFAYTFDINESQYAQFAIDDIVEVEVTVYEHKDGRITYNYKLLGIFEEKA